MADDAGALLVRSGLITPSALDEARAKVADLGGTIGEQLVAAGAIDDDALTEFYTSRLLVPQVNPNSLSRLPIRVTAAIPNDMAIELRAIPVALDNENNLTVAMSDPSDRHAVDEIGFFTGAFVVRACATQLQIAWCLAHYYGHVTPLGQRLLQPGAAPVVAPVAPVESQAPAPRVKGVTAQVKAARHKRIQPTSEVGDDTDPVVAPAPSKRAPSIKPPLPIEDIDSGPVITIEHAPEEDRTAPRKVPAPVPKRRNVQPDPPELYARGGEIDVNTGKIKRVDVDEVPSIVIDDALDEGNHVADRAGELEVRDTSERPTAPEASIEIDGDFDRESRPILLEQRARGAGDSLTFRQRAPSVADFPEDDNDEVVVLHPKKVPGRQRPTQVGLGVLPAATRAVVDDAAPAALDDAVTAQVTALPDDDDGLGPTTAVMSAVELDAAIPERSAEVIPGHLQGGRHAFPDDTDDGWGPPGTTIPPPLLGAIPGSDDDAVPGRIPMGDMESAPLIVAPPSPPEASRSSPSITAPSDAVHALEEATSALLALIRELEHATTRDDVVGMMIDHLAATHRRAGFFVIKAGPTKGSTELSVFAITPRPATAPIATLRLDRPSTLQDVVGTRLPYRGPMHDDDSRTFLASVLGNAPAELLLVPIAVRERVVGVLFGDHRVRHTFDDQLALASRAAGQALERILKAKRN